TSTPLVSRTRATLRSAEFGFLGVVVYTRVHTPRFCGQERSAGEAVLLVWRLRPRRTSWFNVGNANPPSGLRKQLSCSLTGQNWELTKHRALRSSGFGLSRHLRRLRLFLSR